MGKTSLYRQLVGKDFRLNLDPTRGIDNNIVDTVDRRKLEKWEEKEDTDGEFSPALAREMVDKLPNKLPPEVITVVDGKDLETHIQRITAEIDAIKDREKAPIVHPYPVSHPQVLPTFQPPPPPVETPIHLPPTKKHKPQAEVAQPSTKQPQKAENPVPKPKRLSPPMEADPEPTPPVVHNDPSPATPTPPAEVSKENKPRGVLNRKQSSQIGCYVTGKQPLDKTPSLVFNVLDFAGQEQYKPMHHCFIYRRALYIVAFKIPDMIDYISKTSTVNPIDEIRYWVHSIHARIYPPDDKTKKKDKEITRVVIVGTHEKDPRCTPEILDEIDKRIKKELITSDDYGRCVNHIYRCKKTSSNPAHFFPVENSIDKKTWGDSYLEESGTKILQEKLEKKCTKLPFIDDDLPIKWLKFEECLSQCPESRSTIPVMKIEQVKLLALKSGITEEEQLILALKFFHDSGKIIYLSKLNNSSLSLN